MTAPRARSGARRPRLLLLSMYPLDRGIWGATARITHLRDELSTLVDLDVVADVRAARALALGRYATSGRQRGLAGIYVEPSTGLPGPADVAFLGLAKALGIPVLTYFRDAQPLFDEYYRGGSLKARLSRARFLPAFRALGAVSTRIAYPSVGLAEAFGDVGDPLLLPPGSPAPVDVPRSPDARQLLFVGGMRYPVHGWEILVEAIERVRRDGIDVGLVLVSRPGEEPPAPRPAWARVERGSGERIHRLLPDVLATVQPRRRSPYNDLAVPIKVLEYLSYGRPILATDATEQARLLREAGAGIVVPDTADGLVDGIHRLVSATPEQLDDWSEAARVAAKRHSWHARAAHVLEILQAS